MQQFQRQAIPEITRVFGHSGLYLSPSGTYPSELSGNMLRRCLVCIVIRRGLQHDALSGRFPSNRKRVPVLIYSLCVLETSPNPEALFEEMVRCLKPEGVLVLLD